MKKRVIVKGPALSASGYGEQARFALRALREQEDTVDLYLINIPWGRTGNAPLEPEEKAWLNGLQTKTQMEAQRNGGKLHFDISLQITIPNEFEKMADVNIGYTAGIETTKVAPQWIEKSNMMDKIIVPSNHSKDVFEQTVYRAKQEGNDVEFDFKLTTPVEVCAFPALKDEFVVPELPLETEWNFLSVAQWGPRKNVEATIRNFLEEFRNESNVGLVMKLNIARNNIMDKLASEARLKQVMKSVKDKYGEVKCHVYLLHGSLTDAEMRGLYRHPKIKAFVTTTHGEGFGLPMFEAAIAGLPIAAPAWSSYVDFLYAPKKDKKTGKTKNRAHFAKIDFDLKPVQKEAVWDGVIQADSQWCWVKDHSVKSTMRDLVKNHTAHVSTAKKLSSHVLENFAEEKQLKKFSEIIGLFREKKVLKIEKINNISFCIPTNGKRLEKTRMTIESIKKQNWGNIPYEIIVCGDIESFTDIKGITLVDKKQEAHSKKVSVLRNTAASKSSHEVVVFCDDDIVLESDWLEKTLDFSEKEGWEVLGNKILNPDATRHWDKATLNPRILVDYSHSDDDINLMQTSGFFLIRRNVLEDISWDETKLVYADRESNSIPEDVQFNKELRKKNFTLKFNQAARVWHNDETYTEFNQQTLKKELITKMTGISFFPKKSIDLEELVQKYATL